MVRLPVGVLAQLLAALLPAGGLQLQGDEGGAPKNEYYWPEGRGSPDHYSVSRFTAPRKLATSFAWKWNQPGWDNSTWGSPTHSGCNIDGQKNIYLTSQDGLRKFTPDGKLLWHSPLEDQRLPTLHDGIAYVTDNHGIVMGISMKNGHRVFEKKFTPEVGTDISGVGVWNGVVVACSNGKREGGAASVTGMDAKNGRTLWEFKVDSKLWNFMPMYAGNNTIIFQDQTGGAYRIGLKDGKRLWKAGYNDGWDGSFTDGLAMVKDGVVYAVHSAGKGIWARQPSELRAYALENGRQLWNRTFPVPSNSQPAVGYLGKGANVSGKLSVVMPLGAQPVGQWDTYKSGIVAMDAKTGEVQWHWQPQDWVSAYSRGDDTRVYHRNLCVPNPYGSPSIDARGTVYLGHFDGNVYAIRDDNGDGKIDEETEVSSFDAGDAFSHGGAALAPGMLAIPSCNTLYVFKEK